MSNLQTRILTAIVAVPSILVLLYLGALAPSRQRRRKDDQKGVDAIDELFLRALARYPVPAEKQEVLTYFQESTSKGQSYQDVLWSLVNTSEFIFLD